MIRSSTLNRTVGLLCSALMLGPTSVLANPLGGQVVGGQATIQGQGTSTVTVTQSSQNAILNWNTFNIGTGELTQFVQPNASSVALNRVIGGLGPSQIDGKLTANGQIFLVNPYGFLFGSGASVNTAGFLATTHDIANSDFMAGRYNFNIPGRPDASIVNLGHITATDGGFAALVAPGVRNAGVITANLGQVALASGNGFTLDFYGDKLITLQVGDKIASQVIDVATGQPLDALVKNEGKLQANGGQVALTAVAARHVVDSVINNTGVIEANSVGMKNGMIVLGAATAATKGAGAPTQTIKISGKLKAKGRHDGEKGGVIQVTGEDIQVTGAKINASGQAGGGTVLIGRDSGGVAASTVSIDSGTVINASATTIGDGGKVVVWSSGLTSVAGTINATGGASGGNGGFVETSGQTVNFAGIRVNTSAPNGTTGMWLVDPTNLIVDTDAANTISTNLATTDVTLSTQGGSASGPGNTASGPGDIIINAAIGWSSEQTLTLDSMHAIKVNAPITVSGSGELDLFVATDKNLPMLSFGHGGNIQFTAPDSGQYFSINEQGYTLLYSMQDVQHINNSNLNGHYALATSLDASSVGGWTPIGTNTDGGVVNYGNGFNGSFQGLGNSISNLTINQPDVSKVGLFGYVGSGGVIANLQLVGGSVSGTGQVGSLAGYNAGVISHVTSSMDVSGHSQVGGLVGYSAGAIFRSRASGTVTGDENSDQVGGLVGQNVGTIERSGASGAVTGSYYVGGLVGMNGGEDSSATITRSYATGPVQGANYVGGLVGENQDGTISRSYASGGVQGTASVGGLVGLNTADGNISISYALGTVSGTDGVGGLVGTNMGTITQSYASGAVAGGNGPDDVGGLVGYNASGGMVTQSYATNSVTGLYDVGGLVGHNDGAVSYSYATGAVSGGTSQNNFGLGGLVGYNTGTIMQSYATGNAIGMNNVGGLVGWNTGTVEKSYAIGAVTGSTNVGGLVGSNGGTITETFASGLVSGSANVGGLVGANRVTITSVFDEEPSTHTFHGNVASSYWDSEATGQPHGVGLNGVGDVFTATGLTTADSFKQSSYAWDFSRDGGTWFMIDGKTRPFLQSEWSPTITNTHQLQLMAMDLNAHYRLANDVSFDTAFNKSNMWSEQGFVPIGQAGIGNAFTGTFNGTNHTIDHLTIAPTDPNVTDIGLFGVNEGTIKNIQLTNAVITANPNTGQMAQSVGALVGQNFGSVRNASVWNTIINGGNVLNVSLGGLVGYNAPGAVISASFAQDVQVTSTAIVNNSGPDCSATNSCQWVNAGGLVGQNQGTILGFQGDGPPIFTNSLSTEVPSGCGTCLTWANASVSVGSGATAGGLVGMNDGIIRYAFATGNVTGDAGSPNGTDSFGHSTNLGGLVGTNQGWIDWSFAAVTIGDANSPRAAFLQAGGLVGDNGGLISNSAAIGAIWAGDHSQAGGLAANNNVPENNCTPPCTQGDGYRWISDHHQFATIINSGAAVSVNVGDSSIAGGFVGSTGNSKDSSSGNATIDNSWAMGGVTGGANSILGGFAGVQDYAGLQGSAATISNSRTVAIDNTDTLTVSHSNIFTNSVASTGPNSIVGGFVGVNGGQISNSKAAGSVSGTSDSYLGGFVGINVGSVQDSHATGNVAGSLGGNVVGGFAAVNAGMIDPSTSSGIVSSGPNSIVGAFVGANGPFTNLPPNAPPGTSFPGTIDSQSGSTYQGAPQIGSNSANSGNAALPSIVPPCGAALCQVLVFGLEPSPPSPPPPPDNTPPSFNQQWSQQVTPPSNSQNDNTPIQVNLTTPGPGPGGAGGGGGGGAGGGSGSKPNYGPPPGPGLGRTADEQQYSGVPPPGETRFLKGEVIIQVVDSVPIDQVVKVAQGLGLTLISTQHLDQTHRVLYRFRSNSPSADERALVMRLEKVSVFAAVQPNYKSVTAQTAPTPSAPPTVPVAPDAPPANPGQPNEAAPDLANSDTAALTSLPAGDAAQYVIDKFHLGVVHRLASGRNVTIAVIDSEIDVSHPDLRGSIIERFDATTSPSKPHSHGTGMAGAIVSRTRLLGVAPGARILAIKAFDESATSAEATSFQILKGLDYAIAKDVRIINMSFAGPRDPMMERTLKSAHDKGIILIAAAGNAGPKSPPLYPGADPSVIAVSATDYADKPFAMANRGKYIAVAAPGVDVMVPAPANGYQLTTGTSVAAAHVSGVAALLLERKPTMTPDELRAILMRTATAFAAKPKGEEDGAGLVDPVGALQALTGVKTSDAAPSRGTVSASVH